MRICLAVKLNTIEDFRVVRKFGIFGIVERRSNMLILYPIDNRNAETLIPIIQKYVQPGTRIYSDNWAAYFRLNGIDYPHFTVIHKTSFKQFYKKIDSEEYTFNAIRTALKGLGK